MILNEMRVCHLQFVIISYQKIIDLDLAVQIFLPENDNK